MMRPEDRHLIVFAKTPIPGRVKRRLAADIGTVAAWRFYRGTVTTILRRLARDRRWRTLLAVTPDASARSGRCWSEGLVRVGQGSGDLGRRMDRALRRPTPGAVVLVGGDIPDIRCSDIVAAFDALGSHDWVFGPAADGGYWLVGSRRRPRFPYIFTGVRWSTQNALADTLAQLRGQSYALVRTLDDVDDGASYWRHIGRPEN